MHQCAQVAPVTLAHRVGRNSFRARPRPARAGGSPRRFGALFLSLAVVVPAALLGLPSAAAAATSTRRTGPPCRRRATASEAHALPGDATNVRIDMTENDGLDVIVAASGGRRCPRPGVANARRRPLPPDRAGTWNVDTGPGCAGPVDRPVLTNQTNSHGLAHRRRTADPVRRQRQPDGPRHVDGAVQLGQCGEDGQHAAARAVRGRHRAGRVAVELGQPGRRRARRAWTGASRSSRPRPSPSAPTSWPTSAATAGTPTPATSPARPTAAPRTRRRRASRRPTTPPAR